MSTSPSALPTRMSSCGACGDHAAAVGRWPASAPVSRDAFCFSSTVTPARRLSTAVAAAHCSDHRHWMHCYHTAGGTLAASRQAASTR